MSPHTAAHATSPYLNARAHFAAAARLRLPLAPSPPRAGDLSTYERARDLPRLLPLWPHETVIATPAAQHALVARLRRALRAERQRGVAGHWAYNLARHADLARAYRAELQGTRGVQSNSSVTEMANPA
jgi:hypothetical protein